MSYLSPEYRAYIDSDAWRKMREAKFRQVGENCEDCGARKSPGVWLQVHHLTYNRLFHERLSDLRVLCDGPNSRGCHERATRRTRRRRQLKKWLGA